MGGKAVENDGNQYIVGCRQPRLPGRVQLVRLGGKRTKVVPLTSDPLSPNNWAGTIWGATAKGTFSATYDDGSFSVTGTMDSAVATCTS